MVFLLGVRGLLGSWTCCFFRFSFFLFLFAFLRFSILVLVDLPILAGSGGCVAGANSLGLGFAYVSELACLVSSCRSGSVRADADRQ